MHREWTNGEATNKKSGKYVVKLKLKLKLKYCLLEQRRDQLFETK